MKYNVLINESNMVLSTNDSQVFFKEFAKLPEGEYTVAILSDASRSARRRKRLSFIHTTVTTALLLEITAILLSFASFIGIWVLVVLFT